ncbi:hypothetical protein Y032_0013g2026 [Ancylostoma ceylanicum]|uniref:Uncharacterized protein n=1 Tax=Ancylostoma ceylanicum TaxID=53326 RepID=A0A016VD40_9BILA|nr:hypothetical protein Y032_0013g2026 [Ancylostoma ceylanicum]
MGVADGTNAPIRVIWSHPSFPHDDRGNAETYVSVEDGGPATAAKTRHATAPRAPNSMPSAAGMLLLGTFLFQNIGNIYNLEEKRLQIAFRRQKTSIPARAARLSGVPDEATGGHQIFVIAL